MAPAWRFQSVREVTDQAVHVVSAHQRGEALIHLALAHGVHAEEEGERQSVCAESRGANEQARRAAQRT